MAAQALLIKEPTALSFCGNTMPYIFTLSPYNDMEKKQDYRLLIKVLVKQQNGLLNEVRSETYLPNDEGLIKFDIANIVDAYLSYYTPNLSLKTFVFANSQKVEYRVDYLLIKNSNPIGNYQSSSQLIAIKGGLSYENWRNDLFIANANAENTWLYFSNTNTNTFKDDPFFLYALNIFGGALNLNLIINIKLNDGSTLPITITVANTTDTEPGYIICIAAGYTQLNLDTYIPAGLTAISYTVSLIIAGTANFITSPFTFILEQRNFYNTSTLIYRNSLGALQTVRLRGQIDYEADYTRDDVTITTPPAYFNNGNLLPQAITVSAAEQVKLKGDTGFISKEKADELRDLFLSPEKYMWVNNRLLPITIINKNAKFYSNNDNLISILIEWQMAYTNAFYSPSKYLQNISTACPAIDTLVVMQLNKNTLQINYSLPIPYSNVEFTIYNTVNTSPITFVGKSNFGIIKLPIDNPATTTPITWTLQGCIVCDDTVSPRDLGPIKTVTLDVYPNRPIVVNNDTYQLSNGLSSATELTPSVLDNDYDPDGDDIEVIAATGATHAGGTYSITADGVVSYTPPSTIFHGQDWFTYAVRNIGASVSVNGTVTITVGNSIPTVYAKIVLVGQNSSYYYNSQGERVDYTTADIWVYFYSDSAGLIPLDVTGLNISFLINKNYTVTGGVGNANTTTPITIIGSGIKQKVVASTVTIYKRDPYIVYTTITRNIFVLQPSTAYIVI